MLQLLFLTTRVGCHLSGLFIVHVETRPTGLAAAPESQLKFVQCQCKLKYYATLQKNVLLVIPNLARYHLGQTFQQLGNTAFFASIILALAAEACWLEPLDRIDEGEDETVMGNIRLLSFFC